MPRTIETRAALELRADSQGDEMALVGYAAKYDSPSKDLGRFRERIAKGAFDRSLASGADIKCLFNHDPNQILGRTKSKTLNVTTDDTGLRFRCILNKASQLHRDIFESVKRGDIDECSFAFIVNGDDGDEFERISNDPDGCIAMRTLKDVDLQDVSAVTYPAYNTTTVSAARSGQTMTPEIRSALQKFVPDFEKRVANDPSDCYEEQIWEVHCALDKAFPHPDPACCGGRFGICETWDDYVIAYEYGSGYEGGGYFKIPYTEEPADNFKFGEPVAVEKDWVESERAKTSVAERRVVLKNAAEARDLQSHANDHAWTANWHDEQAAYHKGEADAHRVSAAAIQAEADKDKACKDSMGNCAEENCRCQNCFANRDEVWEEDPAEDLDTDADDDSIRTAKAARRAERRAHVEVRAADGKVRTKKVDGKNLTKDKFAFVGDPEKTETWKLPIHDADHTRNALARLNQTQGIPADKLAGVKSKIKAAAKKFGIDAESLRSAPMDAEEIEDIRNRAAALMMVGTV